MSLRSKIQNLINASNETTGESSTDLTSAVQNLVDGYGGATRYSISYTLGTNVVSSNTARKIAENESYTTTISTSDPAYTVDVITVTMGGADITSTAVSGNVITIASVTANVAITVTVIEPVVLTSIDAAYAQSGTVYNVDSLDGLRSDLVVTANYSDSTSETVTGYTLSGTLAEGTSVVTVGYGGKTTSFNVTVTALEYHTVTLDDVSVGNYQNVRGTVYMKVNSWNTTEEALYLPKLTSGNYDCVYLTLPTTAKYIKFAPDAKTGDLLLLNGALIKMFDVPAMVTKLTLNNCAALESVTAAAPLKVSSFSFKGCTNLKTIPESLITGYTGTKLQETFAQCSSLDADLSGVSIPSTVNSLFKMFNDSGIRKTPHITSEAINNAQDFLTNCANIEEVTLDSMTFNASSVPHLYDTAPKSFDLRLALASASYAALRTVAADSANTVANHFFHMIPNNDNDVMRSIVCWGDSLTHYGDATHGNMPAQLLGFMASNVAVYNNAFYGANANPNASTNKFKPFFDARTKFYGDVSVIWLGTNDMHLNIAPGTIADYIEDNYISELATDRYIVLNPWTERTCTEEFASRFGNHFLDIQAYTLDNWETITDLTPTSDDQTAVANGNVPPSLLSDNTHINNYGGLVVATAIKNKLLSLGYIDSTWLAS